MSSTNGSQNLLVNLLRPVYRYETPTGGSTAIFTPRLDVCNIDVLTANTVTAFNAAIGDENENVYVGSNAGNDYSNLRGCSNVTALGYAAASNISNTKNSVYIGYNSGANALDSSVNVAIGPNTKGNGISNIYIGSNTGSLGTGSNNILIGHNLTGSNLSNVLLIGPTPTIYGNLSTRKVGIGRDPSYNMDISGDSRISYRLGVGMEPGKAVDFNNNPLTNVPHSLDVSGYSFIRGALGINSDPADYTFNLAGNMKFDDGAGRIIMQKDPCGNSVFNFESYVPGKRAIFSINGDICASSVVAPGSTFTGNVTACNVIANNDISGATGHITDILGTRVFGEDVSGYRGRFGRVDATDISGSRGTITTLDSTTFSAVNFSTSNIVLPGYLRDALTPDGLDISGGNITAKSIIRANNFIGALDTTSNKIGGVTLCNTNITYAGAISNTNAGANNTIGGVTLSNGIISNSGSTTSANFFGTASNSNNIGGVTLSNGVISNSSTTINSIGGVTLSNGNITGTFQGAIATSNAVISGYIRNALTPSQFDISGGNINNTATHTASNFVGTADAASNRIGGVTLSNSIVAASSAVRDALTPSTYDISTGGMRASNVVLNATATSYIRNAPSGWTIDISSGNLRGGSGSVSNPAFGFVATDTSAGMYLAAANQLGIAVAGTPRLLIDNSSIGIGQPASATKTALFEIAGGYTATGASTTRSFPAMAFQAGDTVQGGYRHFIRTRHFANTLSSGNAIDFFTNNSTIKEGSSDPGTGNLLGLSITSGGVGVGMSNPAFALDVSGVVCASNAAANAGVIAGFVRNAATSWTFDISSGNIAYSGAIINSTATSSNSIGGVILSNSIVAAATAVRNALTPTTYDISTGGMRASNVVLNGTAGASNGYIRNAATSWTFDISSGNFRGGSGSVSNPAFGFVATDTSAGMYLAAANRLGIAVAGTPRLLIDNSSIGIGNPASATKTALLELGGGYTGSAVGAGRSFPTMSFQYGDTTAGGFRHFIRTRHDAATASSNNSIDIFTNNGATAELSSAPGSNNVLAMSITSTGVGIGLSNPLYALDVSGVLRASNAGVVTTYVRNALAPTTFDISTGGTGGLGNISNSGNTISVGGFRNAASAWTIDISGGNFRGGAGTVSNPTYAFTTDTSAGLYLPSASNLGVTIAGVERMRIASNGNVGIATTTPSNTLDINGGLRVAAGTSLFDVSQTVAGYATMSTNGYIAIYAAGTTNKATSNLTVSLASDNGGNHLFMRSTKMGIGTDAPQVPLDVSGTLRVNGGFGTANTRIVLGPSPSAGNLDYASVIQSTQNIAANYGSTLSFWTHAGGASAAEPVQRMTLDNAGRVGILCNSPAYTLDICASPGTAASINMNTWPRIDNTSNFMIVRGTSNVVGNTINWSNAQQNTISTNLVTVVLNSATGCSFKFLKSGIWSIVWSVGVNNGWQSWIDVSTGDNSNVACLTAGNPVLAVTSTSVGNFAQGSWTGYLPSNSANFYKIRNASVSANGNNYYLMITFLSETSNSAALFPYF